MAERQVRSIERSAHVRPAPPVKPAPILTVMRFSIATGEDLEATKAFDKSVCEALDIAPEAESPLFRTDPSVHDW